MVKTKHQIVCVMNEYDTRGQMVNKIVRTLEEKLDGLIVKWTPDHALVDTLHNIDDRFVYVTPCEDGTGKIQYLNKIVEPDAKKIAEVLGDSYKLYRYDLKKKTIEKKNILGYYKH